MGPRGQHPLSPQAPQPSTARAGSVLAARGQCPQGAPCTASGHQRPSLAPLRDRVSCPGRATPLSSWHQQGSDRLQPSMGHSLGLREVARLHTGKQRPLGKSRVTAQGVKGQDQGCHSPRQLAGSSCGGHGVREGTYWQPGAVVSQLGSSRAAAGVVPSWLWAPCGSRI